MQATGFLQKRSLTFNHLIYTSCDHSLDHICVKSLQDALYAAKASSSEIPLPEKLNIARLLALAVLRFHSTPWLQNQWQSQDIVFYGVKNNAQDALQTPFLRSRVATKSKHRQVFPKLDSQHSRKTVPIVRNQTLYSFGVLLVELAYDAPLQDLQIADDDQGDAYTVCWTARRLGDHVWRKLGPKYADAVKICLYDGFGANSELEDARVQRLFFEEVIRKLEICAEAVAV